MKDPNPPTLLRLNKKPLLHSGSSTPSDSPFSHNEGVVSARQVAEQRMCRFSFGTGFHMYEYGVTQAVTAF